MLLAEKWKRGIGNSKLLKSQSKCQAGCPALLGHIRRIKKPQCSGSIQLGKLLWLVQMKVGRDLEKKTSDKAEHPHKVLSGSIWGTSNLGFPT